MLHMQIRLSDIDFFVSGDNLKELLKIKEEIGTYPPRFNVVISCSPTAKHHMVRFKFTGAERDILFDIPLIPLPISSKLVGIGIYLS